MSLIPYENFTEWERDMNRLREHPKDVHLLNHVRNRVNISSVEIQAQVQEYLLDSQFEKNPVASGQDLARRTGKMLWIRHSEDPWFHT